MISPGLKGRCDAFVTKDKTAITAGSGTLEVFATPYMAALMENAAYVSLTPYLDADQSSVGTQLSISHSAATPVGMKVWAESVVTAVDGKKISFEVTAFDECGPIGSGTHERFIIGVDRFLEKCYAKKGEKV